MDFPELPANLNPLRSEPAERMQRTIDRIPAQQPSSSGGGGTAGDWPLKLVAVDTENVKVLLGTVSGFTPTGINSSIDVSGTDATWAIYMHASISGTAVTAVEVLSDNTGTVPADDGTNSYRLIGEVDVLSGVITEVRPSMAWSQTVITCTDDTAPHDWLTGA